MDDDVTTSADYLKWIGELKRRYRATQIKAAVAVNSALIEFYWNLGKDISEKYPGKKRGVDFFGRLSRDLLAEMPEATSGLSSANVRYAYRFFALFGYLPQAVEDNGNVAVHSQLVEGEVLQRPVGELVRVPWGHHRVIIDKCKGNREKALFYVRRTIQNGWSRAVLLNWLSTDLYEREGRGQSNFAETIPSDDCDLARQLVKDPQIFEVFGLTDGHRERDLKSALVSSVERTLLAFGRGVAFVGREYPVELDGEERRIDLLFYVIPLHRYLVVEVKTEKFAPADLGQLLGYKVMVEHSLNTVGDNEPIGLLVCRDHSRVLVQYMMDQLRTPLGVTDYELRSILPAPEKLQQAMDEC